MKVLHLIDSLEYSSSAEQLRLLGPALAQEGVSVEICCLGSPGPWSEMLRKDGVAVHALEWKRWFDPSALLNLAAILRRCSPDLLHVWRLPALRALASVARDWLPRVVMSAPLPVQGQLAWWDRWLLQQVRCLAVRGVSDQHACIDKGICTPALRVVPSAVAPAKEGADSPESVSQSIVCIGRLERDAGFREALWAFDILRHVYLESRLTIVGSGPYRAPLMAAVEGLQCFHLVDFVGDRRDISPLLRGASAVWIPGRANRGRQVALDAMAHGKVVIASDVPCLRDVIIDGDTGFLLPPGEVVGYARRTRKILREPALAVRLGETARRHVEIRFSIAEAVRCWSDVYRSVAA